MTVVGATAGASRAVRFTFWAGVFLLWLPLCILTGLATLWVAAEAGIWSVPGLPPAPTLAAVRDSWGEPDDIVTEPNTMRSLFADYAGCPLAETREVWFYDRLFRPDSVVFVGGVGQVLCVSPGKRTYFFYRSH
jgi:hypothetical protein